MSKDKRTGWLADLKVGDKVVVSNHWNRHVHTVDNITPTGRLTVNRTVFDSGGSTFGKNRGYHPYRLEQATEQVIEEISQEKIVAQAISKMNDCRKVTYEQAVKILEVLEPAEENS